MEALEELDEAVKNIIAIADKVNNTVNTTIRKAAPLMIHQEFCHELTELAKQQPKKPLSEIPEALEVLTAIRVLERLHPELSS